MFSFHFRRCAVLGWLNFAALWTHCLLYQIILFLSSIFYNYLRFTLNSIKLVLHRVISVYELPIISTLILLQLIFLSFKWNGSLYIYPLSSYILTDWSIFLHNALESHLKPLPEFRAYLFILYGHFQILKIVVKQVAWTILWPGWGRIQVERLFESTGPPWLELPVSVGQVRPWG